LTAPGSVFAQQPAVRTTVAESGSEVDAALQNSLNLSVRAITGLQTDKVTPWARIDRDRLNAVLHAFGFYEGNVHIVVDRHSEFPREANGSTEAKRALDEARIQLSFVPVLGPLYRVRSVRIVEAGNGEARSPVDGEVEMLDRMRGERATAERLAQLEAEWLVRQRNAGRAFAIVTNRKVSPDASSHRLDVTLFVREGPQVKLGSVEFQGLRRIERESLEQYIPFRPGDPYRAEQIDRLRTALKSLPFFESVRVGLANAPDASGLLPVTVTLVEKPPETQRLMLSGLVGTAVLGLTTVMLAMSLLAGAGALPSWQRYGRQLSVGTWTLLLASALLALQRLLYLADA
jgi:outer membrane protein assembly factor BamA